MKDVLESPRIHFVVAAALATAGGIGGGWALSAWLRADGPAEAPSAVVHGVVPPEAPAETADRPEEPDAGEDLDYAGMMEVLEAAGMRTIPVRALFRLDRPAVEPAGRVSGAVAEALLLSAEEVERLERAIAGATEQLREIELERMEQAEISEGRAVFRIPAYADEGADIEAALRRNVLGELGEADGELFWALMENEIPYYSGDYWRGFGREEILVVFEWRETPSGRIELRVERGPPRSDVPEGEERRTPGGVETARIPPEGPEGAGAALAGRHRYLAEFLPAEGRPHFAGDL